MSIITKTQIRVRYAETDQMGVVHHGNYATYLELARIEWLDQLGVSYRTMEKQGVMLPVHAMQFKFKKSAFFDDNLTIVTILREKPRARIIYDFEIYNQEKELLTTASVTLVFMDVVRKKPIPCPDYLLELIEKNE